VKRMRSGIWLILLCVCAWVIPPAWSQDPSVATPTASVSAAPISPAQVPRLVRFSGTLLGANGTPQTGVTGITFLFYKDQSGGAPLWMETQNVPLDAKGHYSVLLGSSKPDGLPTDLFAAGDARWLAVQPEQGAEQPRVLLLSVPYALKAMDAETLGGRPVSDFTLSSSQAGNAAFASTATPHVAASSGNAVSQTTGLASITGSGTKNFIPIWTSSSALGNSTIFETGGKVGIGTTTPADTFQITAPNQLGLMVQGPITGVGAGIDLQTTGSGGKEWEILATGNSSSQGVGKLNIRNVTTGQDRLTIATSGIGIGTTTPGFTLDVNGNTNVSGSLFGHFAGFTGTVSNPILDVSQGGSGGGINVFTASGGDGIFVKSQGAGAVAVSADTPNGAVALLGTNENDVKFANAIQGQANGGTQETIGVRGSSQSPIGIGTLGNQGQSGIFHAFEGVVGAGVWGDTNGTGGNHVGVVGTSDDAIGVGAHTNGTAAAALYAQNDTTTPTALLFDAIGGSVFGECFIDVSGNLHCTGNVTGVVATKNGEKKSALYAVESPENWFEDFGSGRLSNGSATIALDPEFAETVNTGVDYHVFLTPNGESKGLYVSQKGPSSFEVRESGGGSSSISFDYRIVAHRKGQEGVRMADLTERMQSHQRMAVKGKP
jgi:hypothetical protein